ncbi:MAG TPA: hypothetical protein VHK01_16670 [Lacipirellulaceae bacterium]|jgi:hypothetical protein|nr:hypothetical protein [Lacipirellulaceae bacterium]
MRAPHWNRSVLGVAAAIEAVTGLVLIAFPHVLIRLLFGAEVAGVSIAIGRVAGIALLSLGVGCWMGRQETGNWALFAMLIYNSLVTIYLTLVGFGAEFVGMLLWPAAALHAALTGLLAYPLIETR